MLPLALPAIETYGKNKPEFKNVSQKKLNQSSALTGSWETFTPDFLIFGSFRDHKEEVCDVSAVDTGHKNGNIQISKLSREFFL